MASRTRYSWLCDKNKIVNSKNEQAYHFFFTTAENDLLSQLKI